MLFDTHTHLDHPKFDQDRADVLSRARAAGVDRLMLIGTGEATSRRALALAEEHEGIYVAIGVHPHEAAHWTAQSTRWVVDLARHPKVKAIGEIGLDYHYHFATPEQQFTAFRDQIRLARSVGLPIIVHNREADADVLKVLEEEQAVEVGGVMHCWSAGLEAATAARAMNLLIGIGGSVTFPRNEAVREVARQFSDDAFVLETDCPYLAPIPHRGRRNEPAHVRTVSEFLAKLRGSSLEALAATTTANACRLLQIS